QERNIGEAPPALSPPRRGGHHGKEKWRSSSSTQCPFAQKPAKKCGKINGHLDRRPGGDGHKARRGHRPAASGTGPAPRAGRRLVEVSEALRTAPEAGPLRSYTCSTEV